MMKEADFSSLHPRLRKPVITSVSSASAGLGAFVTRAKEEAVTAPHAPVPFPSSLGITLSKLKSKPTSSSKAKVKPSAKGEPVGPKNSGVHKRAQKDRAGLSMTEDQKLAKSAESLRRKAELYEAMEKGEAAVNEDCHVDFSSRMPPEPTRPADDHHSPPSPGHSAHEDLPDSNGWNTSHFKGEALQAYSPRQHPWAPDSASPQHPASPTQEPCNTPPQQRPSPTYEPYHAHSKQQHSPAVDSLHAKSGGPQRRGLGYGEGSRPHDSCQTQGAGDAASEELLRRKKQHYDALEQRFAMAEKHEEESRQLRAKMNQKILAQSKVTKQLKEGYAMLERKKAEIHSRRLDELVDKEAARRMKELKKQGKKAKKAKQ